MTKEETAKPRNPPQPARPAEHSRENEAREVGGPRGPEPTRYGDWERKGRCVDF